MRFCIILGAAKSGTTSLFNYFSQHPEIAACKNKEPNYFSLKYDLGDSWYFSLWDKEDIESKVLLEATVNYTGWPTSPKSSENMLEFCKRHNASMKFIYIMRNPIERFESHHTYNYAHRSRRSFEDSLENKNTISSSCYAEQLNLYFEKFDSKDFLLLDFNDLKSNPKHLLRKVCHFLKINPDFDYQDIDRIHNKTEGFIVSGSWRRLVRKYPFIQKTAERFPKGFRSLIYRLIFRETVSGRFKLSETQKQRLHDILKDDMAQLEDKYGINVSKWGF